MNSNGEHVGASILHKQRTKITMGKKNGINPFERLRGPNKSDRINGAIQIIQQFQGNHVENQVSGV